ncbi:MAG: hypothetical protein Q9192_006805 [Flavoplaca navasiana]
MDFTDDSANDDDDEDDCEVTSSAAGTGKNPPEATSSRNFQKYETQYDINHVRDRFPFASKCPLLVDRLGKANAQRRQWLSYQRRHREELAAPTAIDESSTSFNPEPAVARNDEGLQGHSLVQEGTLDPTVRTGELRDPYSILSSTKASTFYHMDEQPRELSDTDSSETAGTETSLGALDNETNLVPQPPIEAADQNPFECPYCFSIITIASNNAWRKHVYADLACYLCTNDYGNHPLFETRDQWFSHELEEHRRQWICDSCQRSFSSIDTFKLHMAIEHARAFLDNQLIAFATRSTRPMHRIQASACPLCDYEAIFKRKLNAGPNEGPITVSMHTFRNHLGRHLEHMALFVLPKQDLTEQEDDVGGTMVAFEGQVTISSDTGESDEDEQSTSETRSDKSYPPQVISMHNRQSQTESRNHAEIDDRVATIATRMIDVLAQYTQDAAFGKRYELLDLPLDLVLKWMPPMDFTPNSTDFEVDDDDLMPRREEPMFSGDIFTPSLVRNYRQRKKGFCGRCTPGTWYNLEDTSYEKDLTYMHGIASSGRSLPRASKIGWNYNSKEQDAYCDFCCGWRRPRKTDTGWKWFRHCTKEHGSSTSTPSFQITPSLNNAKGGENQDLLQPDVPTSAQLDELNQMINAIRMHGAGNFD